MCCRLRRCPEGASPCVVCCVRSPGRPRGHQISRRSYRAGRSRVKDGQRSQPPAPDSLPFSRPRTRRSFDNLIGSVSCKKVRLMRTTPSHFRDSARCFVGALGRQAPQSAGLPRPARTPKPQTKRSPQSQAAFPAAQAAFADELFGSLALPVRRPLAGRARDGRRRAPRAAVYVLYGRQRAGGVWKTTDYGASVAKRVGRLLRDRLDWRHPGRGTRTRVSCMCRRAPTGIRSNVIIGTGVYKSINGGASWRHVGLENTGTPARS